MVSSEIVDSAVWRLTVADSVYRTDDGLGVETTLQQLLDAQPDWAANGETGVFVGLKSRRGLSFRLDSHAPGVPRPWIVRGVDALRRAPPGTPADQVLVVGSSRCTRLPA